MTDDELAAFLERNATKFLLAFLTEPALASLRVDASGLSVVGELRVAAADHARLVTDVRLRAGMADALSLLSRHAAGRDAVLQPIRAGVVGGLVAARSGELEARAETPAETPPLGARLRRVRKRGGRT